ncbi:hypothetical protein [Rhizobium lusitanum]|uniref:Uncharacterized protein n=1 Tax=Rhizobium lusitanum TaxID=293958 RepID=A0A1C3WM71_9HYPH|nr:hypothetical protein [Rhizobium lusitanum]SCB41143.1 hypothetical protein GA0061101_113116 [Rhizobium lusitanum]
MTPFDYIKIGGGIVIGAALAIAPAYLAGRHAAIAEIVATLQAGRVTILKDGQKIDEQAIQADDADLCLLLGGCVQPDGQGD